MISLARDAWCVYPCTYGPIHYFIHISWGDIVRTRRSLTDVWALAVMLDAYLVEEVQKDGPGNEHLEVPRIALVVSVVIHCLSGRHCHNMSDGSEQHVEHNYSQTSYRRASQYCCCARSAEVETHKPAEDTPICMALPGARKGRYLLNEVRSRTSYPRVGLTLRDMAD